MLPSIRCASAAMTAAAGRASPKDISSLLLCRLGVLVPTGQWAEPWISLRRRSLAPSISFSRSATANPPD